jgi:hypothetical protein
MGTGPGRDASQAGEHLGSGLIFGALAPGGPRLRLASHVPGHPTSRRVTLSWAGSVWARVGSGPRTARLECDPLVSAGPAAMGGQRRYRHDRGETDTSAGIDGPTAMRNSYPHLLDRRLSSLVRSRRDPISRDLIAVHKGRVRRSLTYDECPGRPISSLGRGSTKASNRGEGRPR